MAVEVPVEDVARILSANPSTDADVRAALETTRSQGDVESCAALGASYMVGNVEVPAATAGILPLLELIESPFLDADTETFSLTDVCRTLYVLVAGIHAVAPVATIARKRALIEGQKRLAESSPEHFRVYLDALARNEDGWREFDSMATDLWNKTGTDDIQLAAEVVTAVLNDAFAGFAVLPNADDDAKKNDSTLNGSGA